MSVCTFLASDKIKRKKNFLVTLCIVAAYFLFYLLGRFIWCDFKDSSILRWLFITKPMGEHSYLYGWLLSSNLLFVSLIVSALPSIFGKYRYSIVTVIGFILGFVAGLLFGPNPEGAAIGQTHFGWAIWGVIYLASIVLGIIIERYVKKIENSCKSRLV